MTLKTIPSGQFYSLDVLVSDQAAVSKRKSVLMRITMLNMRSSNGTGAGEVYIGSPRLSIAVAVSSGSTLTVPVYVNTGMMDLEGVDVTVTYDTSVMRYQSTVSDFLVIPATGSIRIIGLSTTSKKRVGVPKIADISFTGALSTSTELNYRNVLLADKMAESIPIPAVKPTACSREILGDANKDCVVDIRDAAFIQTYTRESRSGFASQLGQKFTRDVSSSQKSAMDIDKNGVVGYNDATMAMSVVLGYSKFIATQSITTPQAPACKLLISASLKNKDGTAATNTQAFVILSYKDSSLNSELTSSGLTGIKSYTLASGANKYGRVFQLNQTSTGIFKMEALKPTVTKNGVGVTLIVVVTTSAKELKVTDTFRKPAVASGSPSSITISSGVVVAISETYQAQNVANFSVSNSLCKDPSVTKHLKLVFNSNFNSIRGKEAEFVSSFKAFFENKYKKPSREVIASNITVKEGSIIVDFDVTVIVPQGDSLVADVTGDVKSGLTFNFGSESMQASQTLIVDGKENIPPPQPGKGSSKNTLIIVIVVVVVVVLIFVVVALYLWVRKRKFRNEKVSSFEIDNHNRGSSKVESKIALEKTTGYNNRTEFKEVVFTHVKVEEDISETAFTNSAYQSQEPGDLASQRSSSPEADHTFLNDVSIEEKVNFCRFLFSFFRSQKIVLLFASLLFD